jgi:vacuolar-type H+-ATPase subunit F/Vma7
LTQALALGKPVICSPLPSYLEVAKRHPGAFLIADSPEEWEEKLKILKENQSYREQLSQKALMASQDYSIEVMGNKWLAVLLSPQDKLPTVTKNNEEQEPVDIIITNYNNIEYLKLCFESIKRNTVYPYRIIISDAGSNAETWEYYKSLKDVVIIGSQGIRRNYSETCNAGIAGSKSDYFAILNSDVIVSEKWLENIINKFDSVSNLAACGVLSNCDRGWLF